MNVRPARPAGGRLLRESATDRRERALAISGRLAGAYPGADCELHWQSPWQLLVATILSAQCTDKMVNEVTPALFDAYPDPARLAKAPPGRLESLIRRTGFYKQKAKALRACARGILERFGGEVPTDLDSLISLQGVGRKTASVVRGTAFGLPAVFVDTHVKRISRRLGLTREEDPDRIEAGLRALLPQDTWTAFCHRLIHHGRRCCSARSPRCEECALAEICPRIGVDDGRRRKSTARSKR